MPTGRARLLCAARFSSLYAWIRVLSRERGGSAFPDAPDARVQRLFQLLFARPATADEVGLARRLLARLGQAGTEAAWRDLAHVLLCSNELIYLD